MADDSVSAAVAPTRVPDGHTALSFWALGSDPTPAPPPLAEHLTIYDANNTFDHSPERLWNQMPAEKRNILWSQINLAFEEQSFKAEEDLRSAYRAFLERAVRQLQQEPARSSPMAPISMAPISISLDGHRVNYYDRTVAAFPGARLFPNTRAGLTERLYARGLDGWRPSQDLPGAQSGHSGHSFATLAHVYNVDPVRSWGVMDGIMEIHAFPRAWYTEDRTTYNPWLNPRLDIIARAIGGPHGAAAAEQALLDNWDKSFAYECPEFFRDAVMYTGTFLLRHAIALALFRLLAANEICGAVYGTAIVSDCFFRFYVLGPSRIAVDYLGQYSDLYNLDDPPASRGSVSYSTVFHNNSLMFERAPNWLFRDISVCDPDEVAREERRAPHVDLEGCQRLINITQAAVVRVGACNPFDLKPLPTPIQDEAAAATIAALVDSGLPTEIASLIFELSLGNQPTPADRIPWHSAHPARVFGSAEDIAKEMKEYNPFNRTGRFDPQHLGVKYHAPQAQKQGEPYAGHHVIESVVDNLVRLVLVTRKEMDKLIETQVAADLERYKPPTDNPASPGLKA
ncbi:hypothetical protein Q8F55_001600 [Vanrija albida]|uniref:Uncharacterized protein n=1 Tax=Vanrija albida TaxID=181172 RepID=A0ABR3QGI5_9TREE